MTPQEIEKERTRILADMETKSHGNWLPHFKKHGKLARAKRNTGARGITWFKKGDFLIAIPVKREIPTANIVRTTVTAWSPAVIQPSQIVPGGDYIVGTCATIISAVEFLE